MITRLPPLSFIDDIGKRIKCLYCFNRLSNECKAPSLRKARRFVSVRFFNHDSASVLQCFCFDKEELCLASYCTVNILSNERSHISTIFFSWLPEYGVIHYCNVLTVCFFCCVLTWASIQVKLTSRNKRLLLQLLCYLSMILQTVP